MPKRLGKFELPSKLTKIEEGATPTYAKFIAEPFEAGYGHTVGIPFGAFYSAPSREPLFRRSELTA